LHPWFEPIEQLAIDAEKLNLEIINPKLGETKPLNELQFQTWWK